MTRPLRVGKPPAPPPAWVVPTAALGAAKRALRGCDRQQAEAALAEYGDWSDAELRAEIARLTAELTRVNPDGGVAWGFVNTMAVALAAREAGATRRVP